MERSLANQERGREIVALLPEVMPEDAGEAIRPVYEDIRKTLRVPFVNFIFRTLANEPDYFRAAWAGVRPVARTRDFEQAADALRSQALVEPRPEAPGVVWSTLGEADQARAFTRSILYVLPKLLLVATAFAEALDAASGASDAPEAPASPAGPRGDRLPYGVPEDRVQVPMVAPERADEKVKALFEAIKQQHGHPGVASYFRSLAQWPDLLEAVWERIAPQVNSDRYRERKQHLVGEARRRVAKWPELKRASLPDLSSDAENRVRSIVAVFQHRLIPDLLIDVAWAQAMMK